MNPQSSKSPVTLILCSLLVANLGLLWVQGAQLNRQHQTLTQIHSDIQDLADAMDQYNNGDGDDGSDGSQNGDGAVWAPAHAHRGHRLRDPFVRVKQEQESSPAASSSQAQGDDRDMMKEGLKDQQDANKSAQDAIAKARDDQHKLSISENYRKGQEERKIQEAQYEWTRWVWVVLGILALAFGVRAYIKRNG